MALPIALPAIGEWLAGLGAAGAVRGEKIPNIFSPWEGSYENTIGYKYIQEPLKRFLTAYSPEMREHNIAFKDQGLRGHWEPGEPGDYGYASSPGLRYVRLLPEVIVTEYTENMSPTKANIARHFGYTPWYNISLLEASDNTITGDYSGDSYNNSATATAPLPTPEPDNNGNDKNKGKTKRKKKEGLPSTKPQPLLKGLKALKLGKFIDNTNIISKKIIKNPLFWMGATATGATGWMLKLGSKGVAQAVKGVDEGWKEGMSKDTVPSKTNTYTVPPGALGVDESFISDTDTVSGNWRTHLKEEWKKQLAK